MDTRSTQLPANIGRFRIEALLGSGGMGEVYKAFDPTLQRTIAVKTVRPDIDRPDFLERLYREAQALARLQHPHIVTVYEAGEVGGVVYIAMEYLKGDSLATVLRRGELTFDAKLRIVIQILNALEHAHAEDVIHRDIKPSNVNRQPDGHIKLLDFGLARMVRAETLTLSGAVMGTPHYASPEQLKGERVDHRTDIYSTGALAYEMLSGRRPFGADGDSVATIMFKVLSEPPAPMDTVFSRKFPDLERIVSTAMQKSPEDRYQTAADMRDALSRFLDEQKQAITVAQQDAQLAAQRTIVEARDLLARGRPGEAATLLAEALKENPDASDVRTLLDESRPSPVPPPSPLPRADSVAPVPGFVTPAPVPPVVDADYRTRAIADARSATALGSSPAPVVAPPRVPRVVWWALGGVAAVAIAVGVTLWRPGPSADPRAAAATTAPAAGGEAAPLASATPPPAPPTTAAGTPAGPADLPAAPPGASASTPSASAPAATSAPAASGAAPPPSSIDGATPATRPLSAKALFAATGSGRGSPGLKYRVVQQTPTGGQTDADPETVFRSGDRIRFAFESNVDGYLYVALQGSTGRWAVLFPHPEINGGRNAIRRGEQYLVPDDSWFAFDDNPGTEQVFIILSKEPLNQLPGFSAPVTRQEEVQNAVVTDLQASIRSRDLIFEKDRPQQAAGRVNQASYIVNRDELGKSVAALITLEHRK